MVMRSSTCTRRKLARATCSRTRLSAASVPKEYIPANRQGHPGCARALAFWPATPSRTSSVELIDGSYHDVDSSEAAFKVAGSMAIKEALKQVRAPLSSSRSWPLRLRPPKSTPASSWATSRQPPRPDPGPGAAWQRRIASAAKVPLGQHVRLCNRPAQWHAGSVPRGTTEFDSRRARAQGRWTGEIISKAGGNA